MGNRITGNTVDVGSVGAGANIQPGYQPLNNRTKPETAETNTLGTSSKLFEMNDKAQLLRQQVAAKYVQNSSVQAVDNPDLQQRADKLSELFSGGGKRDYKSVAPYLQGLSDADAKQLRAIYQEKTGRDLLRDATNYLFMDDRFSAFSILAPERIHKQSEPQPLGSVGKGIKMDPPSKEVLEGSEVKYALDLSGEIGGNLRVSHLERHGDVNLEKEGAEFTADYTADYQTDQDYGITFEARYGDGLPEFYTYKLTVRDAESKTSTELGNLAGTAPDSEMYVAYLDEQIAQTKQLISELETRRDQLYADIRNDIGNSSDKYKEVRGVEKQIETLKNALPGMESARTEVSTALADSVGKPIPLKAVLVARENGQAIPLHLYAKNLGGGKWAIVDVTNPAKPRTWTGEGSLPTDALNAAWKNFVSGTNDLPPGQIAAVKPQGLGITNESQPWNSPSAGQSTLKQFANNLGIGSLALGVLGVAAIFGPGTQGAAVPLLLAAGVAGGGSAGANMADRAYNGTFKWNTTETALDVLGVVGGIASLGGIGAITGAGRTIIANGAKYTAQNLGSYTRIARIAENGTNAAGGILIANQHVSAMEQINRGPGTAEQKATATRDLLIQAAATGGLIVLGVGISSKLAKVSQAANRNEIENWIGKQVKVGDALPEGYQWHGNQIKRKSTFVEKNYAPLQINSEGRIAYREGVERLSNPNLMRNNFKAEVENRLRAKGLTGEALRRGVDAEISRVQIHHIIPDELVQSTELGRAAQKAGYNLDEATNLRGMPRKPGDRFDEFDVEHRGSHPRYTESVKAEIIRTTRQLKRRYKTDTLDNVPADILKKEMRRIENEFRQKIKNNDVPMKDGKLALLPMQELKVGGRYEIRV